MKGFQNLHNHTLLTGDFCCSLAAFFFSARRSISVWGLPRLAASDLAKASFARRCWGVWTCCWGERLLVDVCDLDWSGLVGMSEDVDVELV